MTSTLPLLSLPESRVLGVLIEKHRTVPDSYPLTMNSLLSGCNQKTSRNPVLELGEAQVQEALTALRGLHLIDETSGGRAMRYAHNADRVLRLPSQSVILLAVLMLRGPQTAGELRIACDRMHNFADISSVEGFLDEMSERPAGALVRKLGRLPGARESRWMHLLSGAPSDAELVDSPILARSTPGGEVAAGELAALRGQINRLQGDVAQLQATVARLCSELGVEPAPAADMEGG